jgi:hypothetical protein
MTESPPTAYVVCQAEYDAHGPVAAFTTAELAEQHAAQSRAVYRSAYEVRPMPLLDFLPTRVDLHLHAGNLHVGGPVEGEQSWTVEHWSHELPAQPVVTLTDGRDGTVRIHVAAASAEAAVAAFRETVAAMWTPDNSA